MLKPDMSDYHPNNSIEPEGDTTKIAIIAVFPDRRPQ